MDKTKIEWCDSTWNPVTGCFNECEYCYAKRIAERFAPAQVPRIGDPGMKGAGKWDSEYGLDSMLDLEQPYVRDGFGKVEPYPMGFNPTFHRYRLNDYMDKKGRNIFVCSMADLFGDWVPDAWIEEVFAACERAPQHNYIFLTKNPDRYISLLQSNTLPPRKNMWYGSTLTTDGDEFFWNENSNTFINIEPMLEPFQATDDTHHALSETDWVIVGAETGRRKNKVVPKREWIEDIVKQCDKSGIPVFMKDSLAGIWGDKLIQEFPEGLKKGEEHDR